MDTPSIAQMRLKLNERANPDLMDNIGVNEALDMNPKVFMNPNPNSPGIPDIGGVKTNSGLPIGGVDVDPLTAGQQLMPQQGGLPQQQQPEQQQPAPNAPQGQTPPMGNMLNMTRQGQALNAMAPPAQFAAMAKGGKVEEKESTRLTIPAEGHGGVKSITVPRHMWEGKVYAGSGKKAGQKVEGMKDINAARAEVYGAENRDPLTIGQVGKLHKNVLDEHFALPIEDQVAAEKEALARLRKAKHLGSGANTLDESEKLDTVRHERDPEGRAYVGYASKGVAGHSLYTSGHGENQKHHVINTCPGQTIGCGGGIDENGNVDTSKGTCFAPNAESQYVNAAVRRATHEQAKHDPAMTKDWILAHTNSLRDASNAADKKNLVTLFRPNVVDETDVSSRHVIKGLNKQRKEEGKPMIVANSYGKTNELHDPENGYIVTHSNVGPKTKHGASIAENISRDKQRIRSTIQAADAAGKDFRNEEGHKTPPKNSYMVTDVKRDSPLDKKMQQAIKYAKYWSAPRPVESLNEMEKDEGTEGHYNGNGKPTTPDKSHYGHLVINDRRYDYQKQHILHPRLVQVGHNEDGTPHMIPTDSRFKDEEFLPKNRFKTKNGKLAGAILMTTPTHSTSNHLHHSSFTHHVNENHIAYAGHNNGEYEIDPPLQQEMSMGKEYIPPKPVVIKKAAGGHIHSDPMTEDYMAFPEQNFMGQMHNAQKVGIESIHDLPHELVHKRLRNG